MGSYYSSTSFINQTLLTDLHRRGLVTGTFLRLDPLRREAVVASILEEAAIKGPTQINIKEIARRAGVSIGSLYQYFNQRQGLLDFAIEIITRQMIAAFDYIRPYLKEMPLREGIKAYFEGGNQMAKEYQGYIKFFARSAYQNDPVITERIVRPVAQIMLDLTRDMLEAALSRGEVRPDIDLEATARLINTMIIAVYDAQFLPSLNTYYQLTDKNVSPERILENMLVLIENALKAER
jgi:TetR/AcrR family transcriptional regulator